LLQVKPPALVGASTLANEFRCGLNCLVGCRINFLIQRNCVAWSQRPGSDAINVGFGGSYPTRSSFLNPLQPKE